MQYNIKNLKMQTVASTENKNSALGLLAHHTNEKNSPHCIEIFDGCFPTQFVASLDRFAFGDYPAWLAPAGSTKSTSAKKLHSIQIDDDQWELARSMGDGNASKGFRCALMVADAVIRGE